MKFEKTEDSHNHSLETLNQLYEYDDFMLSISTVVDLGCGLGDDLKWWATRTTRDEAPLPLNIQCTGIDLTETLSLTKQYSNVTYQQTDFENHIVAPKNGFDILWCHDAFQYARTPIQTLSNWWNIASPGGMLALTVPVTQQIHRRQLAYELPSGCYYHYSMVSLMYMLATTGWDCGSGFFKQTPTDPWIHAVVYKSKHPPLDPRNATWHQLAELGLLSKFAEKSIAAHNCLRQQDLVITWLDHSLMSMAV